MGSRIKRIVGGVALVATAFSSLAFAPLAHAENTDQAASVPGQTYAHDGLSAATAAASCWDIKQRDPRANDGTYWLQTPTMDAPQRFYCDQTTDGGGWVLIGRGREGWEGWSIGQGDPSDLTTRQRDTSSLSVVQYSNATINDLLGGQSVSGQPDGVRVLRAWDPAGSSYQKIDLRFPKMNDFVWPFKMSHPVSISINGGGWVNHLFWNTPGYDHGWQAVQVYPTARTGWTIGWGYGVDVENWGGDVTSDASFFRKKGRTIEAYAEVYVRPRISSEDAAFARIPDSGEAARTVTPAVSEYAARTYWGVSGNLNGSVAEGNIQVQAFAQIGDSMYVGGNFTHVKRGANGALTLSRGLAAFDVNTGNFTGQTFDFNGQVKALLAMPDNKLLVGGDFTTVNGQRHVGTVLIDTVTGAVDPSWDLEITNSLRGGAVSVKSLYAYDGQVYIGGSFTHLRGAGSSRVYGRNAARVSYTARPDRSWNPELNGAVHAIAASADSNSIYMGGHFTRAHGSQRAWYAAKFSARSGAATDVTFDFVPSTSHAAKYQQTISASGNRVFIGGSEHSLFGYDTTTNERISASITLNNGGDIQASTISEKGVIYASCHCSDSTYQDKNDWGVTENWSRADEIKWVGAWDASTGEHLAWTPFELASQRKTGAWALTTDSNGNLWVGGDFTRSYINRTSSQWNGGFARYDNRDNTAPETPRNLRASDSTAASVTLSWDGVADATSYEVLRDDRAIDTTTSTSIEVPRAGENRYFVRAVDAAGNRSATTSVYRPLGYGEVDPNDPVLLGEKATWTYLHEDSAPNSSWNTAGFDDSTWRQGTAPLGYGYSGVNTTLNAQAARPITTYFRSHFTVAHVNALDGVTVEYVADDGAVVYVNGQEVSRTRMGEGAPTYTTRADVAISGENASAAPTSAYVDASILREGDNVIAVETHANYRTTRSIAMSATVTRVAAGEGDAGYGDATRAINARYSTGEVIPTGTQWNYWSAQDAPEATWARVGTALSGWNQGASPIGWGDSQAATPLDIARNDRAITHYFARDIDLGTLTSSSQLSVSVRADDGVVLYVNGHRVATKRMSEGNIDHGTYANGAVTAAAAAKDPLVVIIPSQYLTNGVNRIGVEEHLNYRSTPSMSFDLTANLTR